MFKNNKIMLLVLLIIVAFAGYYYVYKKDAPSNSDLSTESTGAVAGEAPIGKDLIDKLAMLQSLDIDENFFKDKTFTSLTDFSVPLDNSLQTGRDNPFSPISSSEKAVSSSGSSSSSKAKVKGKK